MKLFDWLRKQKDAPKKPTLSKEQQMAKSQAIQSHRNRITNLNKEFEQLSLKLESIELDFDAPRSKKQKDSDNTIRRMSMIKYETEIREGLITWLS